MLLLIEGGLSRTDVGGDQASEAGALGEAPGCGHQAAVPQRGAPAIAAGRSIIGIDSRAPGQSQTACAQREQVVHPLHLLKSRCPQRLALVPGLMREDVELLQQAEGVPLQHEGIDQVADEPLDLAPGDTNPVLQ